MNIIRQRSLLYSVSRKEVIIIKRCLITKREVEIGVSREGTAVDQEEEAEEAIHIDPKGRENSLGISMLKGHQ